MYGRYPQSTYGQTQPFVSPPRPVSMPQQFHTGLGPQNQGGSGINDMMMYYKMMQAMQSQGKGGSSGGMGGANDIMKMFGGGMGGGSGSMDMFPVGMDASSMSGGNYMDMFGMGGGSMDMFGMGMDASAMGGYGDMGGTMDMFPAGMDASAMSGGPWSFGGGAGSYMPFVTAGFELAGYGNDDSFGSYIGGSHADSQDPVGTIAGPIAGAIVDYGTGGLMGGLFNFGSMFG